MYPDDCRECEICGAPVFGSCGLHPRCGACTGIVGLPRDAKGRWMREDDMCQECGGCGMVISLFDTVCQVCAGTGRRPKVTVDEPSAE